MQKTASIKERIKEVQTAREDYVANLPPFLKLAEGTNEVEILSGEIKEGRYGWLYPAKVNGAEGVLSLRGQLEEKILNAIAKSGKNKLTITRVGLGLDTRYSVNA